MTLFGPAIVESGQPFIAYAKYSLAYLMGLSVWAGMHEAKSTGEPTKPCQSLLIRLGLNAIPKEMSVFYTLPRLTNIVGRDAP